MNLKKLILFLNIYQTYLYFVKNRPFLKLLDRPRIIQDNLFEEIILKNKNSQFGKDNHFKDIISIKDYKNQVSINTYEDLEKYIEKTKLGIQNSIISNKSLFFAITSGTTDKPKFIPETKKTIKSLQNSWNVWTSQTYLLSPKTFSLLGAIHGFSSKSYEGRTKGKIPFGSVSALIHDKQLFIIKKMYCVPDEVLEVEDYELRYYLIIIFILKRNLTLLISPNPSNLLVLAKKLNKHYDELIEDLENNTIISLIDNKTINKEIKNKIFESYTDRKKNLKIANRLKKIKKGKTIIYPKDVFTNLQTIGCWKGGSVGIYIEKLPKYFGNDVLIHEIGYMASEGRFSIPTSYSKKGEGVLEITSNFYEFIEVKDYDKNKLETKLVDELEIGKKYYIIITNRSGLYRYFMDDIVEVVNYYKKTPQIRFVQKGKYFSNLTGEKISEWEIIKIIEKTFNPHSYQTFFAIANIKHETPHYELYIEFNKEYSQKEFDELENKLDNKLKQINIEYESKRKSQRLNKIKIKKLPENFISLAKKEFSKNTSNDTQTKIPKLIVLEKDKKTLEDMKII
ncbi:MAG: GH3 auxin-responsive promoter family protein [Candidatus Woesearchaeota archaeon]|jgi:predicted SprT family Zn-dependent metalloprotease|nr:GH3 auxin-responsive promoter family protein [Candidatus Woesearchaeota archaeon]